MKKSAVLGIDPGRTGSLCLLSYSDTYNYPKIRIYDYTSTDISNNTLICIKQDFNVQFVIIEKQWLWKGEKDLKTAEVLIRNSEMWKTLLTIHGIPFMEVAATTWRKGLIPKKLQNKSGYIKKSHELFPKYIDTLNRHDRCESALIAYRAFKHVQSGSPTKL